MRSGIERLALVVVAAVTTLSAAAARADEKAPSDASGTTRIEVRVGLDAPLGTASAALVHEPNAVFAFGVGAGFATGQSEGPTPQVGAFVRANLVRGERFSLGPVLTFSAGKRVRERAYRRPFYVTEDRFYYRWEPGYRMDAGLGAELALDRFSVRLEAGLGLYLNDPTCDFYSTTTSFTGACDAPQIPEPYHFTFEPGRLAPYLSLGVAYDVGRGAATAADAEAPQPRTDSGWLAQTALTVPKGSLTLSLLEGILVRATFGVTERLQVWAGSSWSVFAGVPLWDVGAKLRAVSAGRFHAALVAEHLGLLAGAYTSINVTGAGVVGSYCLDEACASLVSLSAVGGRLYFDGDESLPETTYGLLVSPSAVLTIARYLKVVVEGHVPVSEPRSGVWAALLRLPLAALTVDLGAMGVFESYEADLLPAGSIAYRW